MTNRGREAGNVRGFVTTSLVAMSVAACHASVKANANVSSSESWVEGAEKWEASEPTNPRSEAPSPPASATPRVAAAVAASPAAPGGVHFLGVMHDLSLSSAAPRMSACRCLAVAYGAPSDPKFTWQAGTPIGDADTLAIAIATDGVGCSGAPTARMSISGVEREGADIVLVVESVGEGRPIMHGALAASPGPGGAILVRTRHDAPYPAASGAGPCRIPLTPPPP